MRKYFLVDWKKEEKNKKILRLCDVASKIRLWHGLNYTEELIRKYWKYDDIEPSPSLVLYRIRCSHIKWYIGHGNIDDSDQIWNGSFLHGISCCGTLSYNKLDLPTFKWFTNSSHLLDMLKKGPFFGGSTQVPSKIWTRYYWGCCVAFYLPFKEDSISFMAGVFVTGQLVNYNGLLYAKYNTKIRKHLEKWGIPIEHIDRRNQVYISPIWPALFVKYMPELPWNWSKLKNAAKVEEYATILWRMYINHDPITNGFPYLPSRRTIYYRYHSIKSVERLIVERNLVSLDPRIGEIVRKWMAEVNFDKELEKDGTRTI